MINSVSQKFCETVGKVFKKDAAYEEKNNRIKSK